VPTLFVVPPRAHYASLLGGFGAKMRAQIRAMARAREQPERNKTESFRAVNGLAFAMLTQVKSCIVNLFLLDHHHQSERINKICQLSFHRSFTARYIHATDPTYLIAVAKRQALCLSSIAPKVSRKALCSECRDHLGRGSMPCACSVSGFPAVPRNDTCISTF
jgi:hypothetical protein